MSTPGLTRYSVENLRLLARFQRLCEVCKGKGGPCACIQAGRQCAGDGLCHGCGGAKVVQAHADDCRALARDMLALVEAEARRAEADARDAARPFDHYADTPLDEDGMIHGLGKLVDEWREGLWNRIDFESLLRRITVRREAGRNAEK